MRKMSKNSPKLPAVVVRFCDVGRERKTWERRFAQPLDADLIAHEATSALRSRSVEVGLGLDLDSGRGTIFAGMHKVGDLLIIGVGA